MPAIWSIYSMVRWDDLISCLFNVFFFFSFLYCTFCTSIHNSIHFRATLAALDHCEFFNLFLIRWVLVFKSTFSWFSCNDFISSWLVRQHGEQCREFDGLCGWSDAVVRASTSVWHTKTQKSLENTKCSRTRRAHNRNNRNNNNNNNQCWQWAKK